MSSDSARKGGVSSTYVIHEKPPARQTRSVAGRGMRSCPTARAKCLCRAAHRRFRGRNHQKEVFSGPK